MHTVMTNAINPTSIALYQPWAQSNGQNKKVLSTSTLSKVTDSPLPLRSRPTTPAVSSFSLIECPFSETFASLLNTMHVNKDWQFCQYSQPHRADIRAGINRRKERRK